MATILGVGPAARADEEAAKPPRFIVHSAAGPEVKGTWGILRADWSVRVGEGEGTAVAGADLLTLRRADAPLPPLPTDDHLILVNGDRIPFTKLRLAGEKLHFRHPNLENGQEVLLPLAAVSVLWQNAPDGTLDAERLRRRLATGTRTSDTVCLRNGDIVAGVLTALDGDRDSAEVEAGERRVSVKLSQVAYVAFNTELADSLRPKGPFARLVLTGTGPGEGGRLSLTKARCDDGATLTGTTVFGARLSVTLAEVAGLDLHQGRAVYLSDLKPSKYEHRPYLDADWPYSRDANVAEHDLLLAGSTYDKGIGLHSHARLTYRIGGAYRRFEALVGLDDRDGRHGSVRVRLLADGEPLDLGADRPLTARGGPRTIRVNVEGIRELTLEVQFGDGGDVQDVVDWVDARLVK